MTWRPLLAPVGCWLVAALLAATPVLWSLVASAAAFAMAAWAAWGLRGRSRGSWRVHLLVCAIAACAVALSCAGRAASWQQPPWPLWVQQRASLTVDLRLTQTPQLREQTPWADGATQTDQTTQAVTAMASDERGSWLTQARVLVRVPGEVTSARLRRGDHLRCTARVSPGDQRAGVIARLDVLSVESWAPDAGWRGGLGRSFQTALSGIGTDRAALVQGLALGEDADLSQPAREEIRSAGLGHLTAVSGANIAMVVGAAMWAARAAGASRAKALIPATVCLGAYVWLVGPEPSVLRAAAMASVVLVGILVGGGTGIAALASAVSVLLVWDPGLASSRGFALSCAATWGLIAATPMGRRAIDRLARQVPAPLVAPTTALVSAVVTAVAAAVATAPLLASYGDGVSWAAVLANVMVAPVVPIVTIGGLAVAGVSLLAMPLAEFLAWLPGAGAGWIVVVARWADGLPGGRIVLPGTWHTGAMVALVLISVALMSRRWPGTPAWVAVAAVVAAVAQATVPPSVRGVPSDWAVTFCDVGQGDAAVLRAGPDSVVIIDAGPEPDAVVDCLQRLGISQVAAVVLSHYHQDHVAGFAQVASHHKPGHLWVSPLAEPPTQVAHVQAAAVAAGWDAVVPVQGQTAQWGAVTVQLLAPGRLVAEGSPPNNASLVVVAEVATASGSVRVLLTGDIEPEAQAALMSAVSDPLVDVAKVPHHGSANQHPRLPGWAKAEWAVVSCGIGNDYGHPANGTLRDWQRSGATTLRTDEQGDIFLSTDPSGQIRAHVSREAR